MNVLGLMWWTIISLILMPTVYAGMHHYHKGTLINYNSDDPVVLLEGFQNWLREIFEKRKNTRVL